MERAAGCVEGADRLGDPGRHHDDHERASMIATGEHSSDALKSADVRKARSFAVAAGIYGE
ncbi:hypothetical protein GCM10009827_061610 [Dactylosporangium maewongense]|uniref:Uncharacterized protein n=1 Tax=Dactylosporangium maewongense TaxID=634393 RepID=A0ABP4M0G0_9ACTN